MRHAAWGKGQEATVGVALWQKHTKTSVTLCLVVFRPTGPAVRHPYAHTYADTDTDTYRHNIHTCTYLYLYVLAACIYWNAIAIEWERRRREPKKWGWKLGGQRKKDSVVKRAYFGLWLNLLLVRPTTTNRQQQQQTERAHKK